MSYKFTLVNIVGGVCRFKNACSIMVIVDYWLSDFTGMCENTVYLAYNWSVPNCFCPTIKNQLHLKQMSGNSSDMGSETISDCHKAW